MSTSLSGRFFVLGLRWVTFVVKCLSKIQTLNEESSQKKSKMYSEFEGGKPREGENWEAEKKQGETWEAERGAWNQCQPSATVEAMNPPLPPVFLTHQQRYRGHGAQMRALFPILESQHMDIQ